MNLKNMISVFVPTHVINASTEQPLVHNWMIEKTIRSFFVNMRLKNVDILIFLDRKFEKINSIAYLEYRGYLENLVSNLQREGIGVSLYNDGGYSLRQSWEIFVRQCKTPYMLFLEHDWELLQPIPLEEIIQALETNEEINYLKFTHQGMDLTKNIYEQLATDDNWNWFMEEYQEFKALPLTRVSFYSGNPHIERVSFVKTFILPLLKKYCPQNRSLGASHWEKDLWLATLMYVDTLRKCGFRDESYDQHWGHLWPLSEASSPGKGCSDCLNALKKQQEDFGAFLYGLQNWKAIIKHLGTWCRKA